MAHAPELIWLRGDRPDWLRSRRETLLTALNAINRAPIDQAATEAIYEVRLTTSAEHLDESRDLMRELLESANYPPRGIEVIEREQGGAELVATLVGTTAGPRELDEIVSRLDRHSASKPQAGA